MRLDQGDFDKSAAMLDAAGCLEADLEDSGRMTRQTDERAQCELCGVQVFGKLFGPTSIFDSNTAAMASSILSIHFSMRSSQGALSGLNR